VPLNKNILNGFIDDDKATSFGVEVECNRHLVYQMGVGDGRHVLPNEHAQLEILVGILGG
jgi:hypothetical protein